MNLSEEAFDFRGLAGQITEMPFSADTLPHGIAKRLTHDRYAWLTTVGPTGLPEPMLVWFRFDTADVTVYTQPRVGRVAHIFQHPQVSLNLESDGFGSGLVILGGMAAVTAEGVDPRDDKHFWAKYHVEADAVGLNEAVASFSTRITITPTTLWTTLSA